MRYTHFKARSDFGRLGYSTSNSDGRSLLRGTRLMNSNLKSTPQRKVAWRGCHLPLLHVSVARF